MRAHRFIRLAHRLTAALLLAFIALHLANHLVGLAGIDAHRRFMMVARTVYRSSLIEPLLLTAVAAQLVTGALQLRAGWGERKDGWARLQAASGAYLALFLANHTFWVLAARWLGLDSDFYLAAAVLILAPLPVFFVPYYVLAVVALAAHLAVALHFNRPGAVSDRSARGLIAAGAVLGSLIVAMFMGAFYEISLPAAYRALAARFL